MVSHELTFYLFIFDLILTLWIMALLSKGWKPDNFESHNSIKLSFMSIQGLHLNFVECEFFLESNSSDALVCVRQTWMTQFILVISLFNQKEFYYSYAWSCSLCEGRTSFCMGLICRKLCRFFLMFLTGFTSPSFSSINHLLCLYAQFVILFLLTLMRFFWSTHLLMCLPLQTLTPILRTG